jgi:hypothetical protein
VQQQVRQRREDAKEDPEKRNVRPPERLGRETKGGEDAGGRHVQFDAELERSIVSVRTHQGSMAVTDLDLVQLEVPKLVDRHRLVCGVEERRRDDPPQVYGNRVAIDEQAREKEAAGHVSFRIPT